MTTVRPPFPTVIDSTMIAAWRACRRKFYLEYVLHYKPKILSVHLHAGASYAKGLEAARRAFYIGRLDEQTSIATGLQAFITAYGAFECPPDSAKSLERVAGAYEYYFTQYPMASDHAIPVTLPGGAKGIEFSFAEPLVDEAGELVCTPDEGDPILYCGRMDMIVDFAGGLFGEDDKTTSQLGASWSKQWDLRSQFTGYCWGARKAGLQLQGFLIRGVSILKTKYETQQALTYRPQWQIDRWYEQLLRDINDMKECWRSGYWDYDLSEACNAYGGCQFTKVCLSSDPDPWLDVDFERRIWDPLKREELSVGDAP